MTNPEFNMSFSMTVNGSQQIATAEPLPEIVNDGVPPELEAMIAAATQGRSIVRHDENGMVTQAILQSAIPWEDFSKAWTEQGIDHILYDGQHKPHEIYVDMETRTVCKKKEIIVTTTRENNQVKADGHDTLTFYVEPKQISAIVIMNGMVQVHEQAIADGVIEFETETPGKYQVHVSGPDHTYQVLAIDIEAA